MQLYKDEVPQGSRKIKGRFDSATDGSITLRLKDGQTRTLEKSDVRKVLTRRPFSETMARDGSPLGSLSECFKRWLSHER